MRRAFAALTLLAAATALAGCANQVYSEAKLFSDADSVGAKPLRAGLWLRPSPKCRFHEAKPVQRWPKCADWVLVRPGQLLFLKEAEGKAPAEWNAMDITLIAGDPELAQSPQSDDSLTSYYFSALRPVRSDEQGRIVELRYWSVLCGPPKDGKLTDHPLAGLEIKESNCIARDPGSVRTAAKASEAWENPTTSAHWVRDTLP